jgi:hypothetical protein
MIAPGYGEQVGQGVLATVPGLAGIAGYYTSNDSVQHVITAASGGAIQEIWWQGGATPGKGTIASIPGVNSVAGYFTPNDGYQHVIAVTHDYKLHEIYWQGGGAPVESLLYEQLDVLGVAGYYTPHDGYHHLATAAGYTQLIQRYWRSGGESSQVVLDFDPGFFPNVVQVAAYYTPDDGYYHLIAMGGGEVTTPGHGFVWEIYFRQG